MARSTGVGKTTVARSGGIVVGGGGIGMIVLWVLNEFWGIQAPPEIGVAIGSICSWVVDLINPGS